MKEKSCGAIVYKEENGELKFLLVHQNNGNYSFPKGHMEENETELETALREIKEETNLDVEIDTDFRHQVTYLVESRNVMKDTVYFLATPKTDDLKPQEGEILNCDWYSYEETNKNLNYPDLKEILESAYNYIKNKNI